MTVSTSVVRIVNVSSQLINLQVKSDNDFFRGQQQLPIFSGKDVSIDEKYLVEGQVENLVSRGLLKIIRPK